MINLFDSNLNYLKEHQSGLFEQVINQLKHNEASSFELIMGEVPNIQCKNIEHDFLLYSKYDPEYECERWLEAFNINSDTNNDFVVYGLGLTYHLVPIINQFPTVKLFIYEPEIEVFIEAMKILNIADLFNHKNIVKISVGKNETVLSEYLNYLYYYAKFPIRVLDIPVYHTLDSNYFLAFLKLLEKINVQRLFIVGFHTLFGNQTFVNSLRNIPKMVKTPSVNLLKDLFKGSTAIIVGGGPSLQYDIEYIKENRNDLLIIAAGSSVQSMLHFGVEPHLIVSMDPGKYNLNVFTRNNLNEIPLLYMPQIHHEIVEVHSKYNVFGYFNNDSIINKYIDVDSKDYTFQPTFSVTGTAIQVAIYMGAENILFAGQDLSYPGKSQYSPGAKHAEPELFEEKSSELKYEVDNVEGGKNPTTFSMMKTHENIETIISGFKDIKFINTSSRGAVIKGADFVPVEKALQLAKGINYIFDEIKTKIEKTVISKHSDFSAVREKTVAIVVALSDFQKTCTTVERKIEKLISWSTKDEIKAEKVLRDIEKVWEKVIEHEVFKDIVGEWMIVEVNQYDQKIFDVVKETDIVKKAMLLEEVLGHFCASMKQKLSVMQSEFQMILAQLD